jgi:pimeloyl-ACP methyl ester carboxylesterase
MTSLTLRLAAPLACAAALLAAAAPASAAERITTIPSPGPGPAASDVVTLLKQGPASADKVLVLMPGTSAGASYFKPVVDALLPKLPGWQVWSVDRRENTLKDTSVLKRAQEGKATGQELFDYYLGWIGKSDGPAHFTPAEAPYAKDWGMRVAVEDLRRVVKEARKGGRRVVLGGHSLGGTIATAYATWDFAGRAGAKDLSGLVYIDGGSGGRAPVTTAAARTQVAEIAGKPFLDLVGLNLPWAAGVFNAVGSTLALEEPDAPSILQAWPLLPKDLKPPVTATNLASYGYALDVDTGPDSLALVQAHLGSLATSGDPCGFVEGGLGTVTRIAGVFSGLPGMDGSSWYHPRRLSLDGSAVNNGRATPAQKVLGLRTTRGRDVKVPIYAFSTSLGRQRVLDGAKALAKQSGVPSRSVTLVDRTRTYAHIDPLSASPATNDFVRTVVPFLRKVR